MMRIIAKCEKVLIFYLKFNKFLNFLFYLVYYMSIRSPQELSPIKQAMQKLKGLSSKKISSEDYDKLFESYKNIQNETEKYEKELQKTKKSLIDQEVELIKCQNRLNYLEEISKPDYSQESIKVMFEQVIMENAKKDYMIYDLNIDNKNLRRYNKNLQDELDYLRKKYNEKSGIEELNDLIFSLDQDVKSSSQSQDSTSE